MLQYQGGMKMDIRRQYLKEQMEGNYFTLTNGQKVKVLSYNTNQDILVLCEDGKERRIFKSQLKDAPTAPTRKELMIGKTYIMKTGDIVTVVAYRDVNDIDVQFPDGSFRTAICENALRVGSVNHPSQAHLKGEKAVSERLHERKQVKTGEWGTIVAYRSSTDCDIMFDDGTLMQYQLYARFQYGNLCPHGYLHVQSKQNSREGLTNINQNGLKMTTIKYYNNKKVLIRFEDGHEAITRFSNFENGRVPHPSNRKNHTSFPEMTILYYLQQIGFKKYPKGYLNKFHKDFKRLEFDAFNEEYMYAVEYDGEYAHSDEKSITRDKLKEQLCAQVGIRLIKIRESGLSITNHPLAIVRHHHADEQELSEIIKKVISDFNQHTNQKYIIDVDIARDRRAIIEMFVAATQILHDRVGETVTATNGMQMTIVAYANSKHMTVQFEDGAIVDGVTYRWFIKGIVGHPNDKPDGRVGQSRISKWGEKMTIIKWKDASHVTIQFDNGDIVETDSKGFYQNGVQSPTYKKQQYQYRVGETRCNNNGQQMRIIAYNKSDDITVEFETGEIREHVTYASFCEGALLPTPVHAKYTEKDALHQTRIAKNGQRMTVTGFRRSYDIDVTFEDGTVVHGVRYADFLSGHVHNPSIEPPTTAMIKAEIQKQQRMNQKYVTNEGDVVTIVYYAHSACMTVRWEDGTEKDGVKYRDLIAGKVRKPNNDTAKPTR